MPPIFRNLTVQVLLAIALGVLIGAVAPAVGASLKPLADLFISLIKLLVAPIIFLTVVLGIGNIGDLKKVGRLGGKALLYFEVVTTLALVIGVAAANLLRPGAGIDTSTVAHDAAKARPYAEKAAQLDWLAFFTHLVPDNFLGAFTGGEVVQVLVVAGLFGAALARTAPAVRQPLLHTLERFSQVCFGMLTLVMKLAPVGALAGMAFTIGTYGLAALRPLALLMSGVYLTMALFIGGVLGGIARWYGFSLWRLLRFLREELLLVLGTSSSESALPRLMDKLVAFGCARPVVGLVVPTGYSFNLDGTTIYLSMCSIFLAQAYQVPLSVGQQLTLIGILMVTSKGAAGVTGSGFVVLASTLAATRLVPVEGLALLLGVDRFMSEARALTNLVGNAVATVVIAKSENQFDEARHQLALAGQVSAESASA